MWSSGLVRRIASRFSEIPKPVSLPELKYNYSALEPVISSKLLETHHKKHHQTYVNNLNAALEQFDGKSTLMQKPRKTSTGIRWPHSAIPSNLTWEDTSTTRYTGTTLLPLAMEGASTQLRTRPFLKQSLGSLGLSTNSLKK